MKKILFSALVFLFFLGFPLGLASSQVGISPEEAGQYVNKFASVCGKAVQSIYMPDLANQPTFIYLEKPYPDQIFTVVIWGSNRTRFPRPPDALFTGTDICVGGMIINYRDTPQIIVDDPAQIRVKPNREPGPALLCQTGCP